MAGHFLALVIGQGLAHGGRHGGTMDLKFRAFPGGVPAGRGGRWGDFRGLCLAPAKPLNNPGPKCLALDRFLNPETSGNFRDGCYHQEMLNSKFKTVNFRKGLFSADLESSMVSCAVAEWLLLTAGALIKRATAVNSGFVLPNAGVYSAFFAWGVTMPSVQAGAWGTISAVTFQCDSWSYATAAAVPAPPAHPRHRGGRRLEP